MYGRSAHADQGVQFHMIGSPLPLHVNNLTVSRWGMRGRGKLCEMLWVPTHPDRVQVMNLENKAILTMPLSSWLRGHNVGLLSDTVQKAFHTQKCGQQCTMYRCLKGGQVVAEFLALRKQIVDPIEEQQWCQMHGIPEGYGLPIKVRKLSTYNRWFTEFDTLSIKVVPVRRADFRPPDGYKACSDKATFFFSESGTNLTKSDLDSLFISK